jgi:GT2 family glycosyltransferase/2-polyprenyl-3-methyl-5-hydroxy-6-metoxy-1,4-benzoquinol methylase/glycosyltransferase involved in cell wall biosynthesis
MTSAVEGQIEFEHYHRYCFARDLCDGLDVLDVASGEGYGSAILAAVARSVVGVEIDAVAVAHAEASYHAANLRFLEGNALALPLGNASVDVVVTFETLEHLLDHRLFMAEVRRVMRPQGLLIVSTPDRAVYSAPGTEPNPHHVLELTDREFRSVLLSHFRNINVLAQRPVLGSLLVAESAPHWRSFERRSREIIEATSGLARANYLVAVASDGDLPAPGSSVYFDSRRVHDVVQDSLQLPVARAQASVLAIERDAARQDAANAAAECTLLRNRFSSAETAGINHLSELRGQLEVSGAELAKLRGQLEVDGAKLAELRDQFEVKGVELATLRRQLEAERAGRRQDAEQASLWLSERDVACAKCVRLDGQIAGLLQRMQASERSLAQAHELTAALQRDRDAWVEDAKSRAEAQAVLQQHVAKMEQELARALEDAALVRLSYDTVINSTSWHLIKPVRSFGNSFPRSARLLRRACKLVWWSMTFQIVARIGLQRQRELLDQSTETLPPSFPVSGALGAEAPLPQERPAVGSVEPNAQMNSASAAPLLKEELLPSADHFSAPEPQLPAQAQHALPSDLPGAFSTLYRHTAIYFPPVTAPEVSVVIPVFKGLPALENCLRSLSLSCATEPSFEVVLIDDCPAEPVLWAIPECGGLRKFSNLENRGFLHTCNTGASVARGRIVCFLNSDTIVFAGWLRALVEALDGVPDAGLAGGMLLNADGTIQDAGWRIMGNGWGNPIGRGCDPRNGAYTYRRQVDCVSGACFAITRQLFDELNGFDLLYAPAFYEEFDLAFRARARGRKAIYEPRSRVVHLGSASYGAGRRDELSCMHHEIFVERFAEQLRKHPWDASDPFVLRHGREVGPVILVADYGVPHPDRHAGDVTISQYLSMLALAGWRVVFAPANGVAEGLAAERLESHGIELVRLPITFEGWLAQHGRHVRHAWVARPEIAQHLIGPLRAHTHAQIAYYPHDLHHLRLQRQAILMNDPAVAVKAETVKVLELQVLHQVDHITAPSEAEARLIRTLAPNIPVSALPAYFYDADGIVERETDHFVSLTDIVFVGGFPHIPNVDAALFIVGEIMPIVWQSYPNARLVLVGYAPPPEVVALQGPRVVVTGQVPDVAVFLDRARLVLAALRFGAGVKGKVVDALRMGVPVVTTPIGAEGIGIVSGRDALIADDAVSLARHVVDLLEAPERCAALSVRGAKLIREGYSRLAARRSIATVFQTPCCSVCGSADILAPTPEGSIREAFVCQNCFALGRVEALARVALQILGRDGEGSLAELARRRPGVRVHELGFVGAIADTLRGHAWYSMSEYFDDIPRGSAGPGNIQCEDATQLTYADQSFDMLISQDVMEHVTDPRAAFAETARVLRPGGSHVFTIPHDKSLPHTITRARLDPYGIEYLMPPEYHGDPVRAMGALVFTDFGRDLALILEEAGLQLVEHEIVVTRGSTSQLLCVFQAIKPGIAAGVGAESLRG